jgi:hypothetical protein
VNNLLDYLFTLYGKITSTDLIENNRTFDQEWDTLRPFQTVMARVKRCCDYAANSEQPYTAKQILAKLHTIVFQTGLYHNVLKKWDELPANQKTFKAFSKHIIHAQTNLCNKKTSKQHGYGGMAVEQMQELTENFANMVTINRQDKENEHMQYMHMRNELAELKAIISKLHQQPPVKPGTRERFPFVDHRSYCWSHGYCVAPKHTSQTC